jgi:hypothetical protein
MNKFLSNAIMEVKKIYEENNIDISNANFYIVWYCKTLQNAKALIISDVRDEKYYEVTYNGNSKEMYIDEYVKSLNKSIDCSDIENMFE